MATDNSLLIEQHLPDNTAGDIDPADVRAVAHALDAQVPNQRRGGPFYVTYLTRAAAEAAGQASAASLDQLEADRLCLGAVARAAHHPDQAGQWLVLVYDNLAAVMLGENGQPVYTGLLVALDGNFQGQVPGKWVKLGSQEATAANVPAYAGNVVYALNYLVRYGLPGGRESFYYALQAGQLPAPVPGQSSASWRLVPGPVVETLLYQYITLDEAGGIEGNAVVAGRRYGVVGKWNGSLGDQLVYLDGLENYFRRRGTVVHDDGTQQEVEATVGLGTYQVAGSGGGGLSRAVCVTSSGRRYIGPLFLRSQPGPLSAAYGRNVYGWAYQVNYREPTSPDDEVVGPYLADIADVAVALAAVPAAAYAVPLGVQVRATIIPYDNTQEASFSLDGLGAGAYEGSNRQFLVSYAGPPLGTLNANSQFRENFPSGWTSNGNVTIGGGLMTMSNSPSDIENLVMLTVTLYANTAYKLVVGVASIGNGTTLNIGWRQGGQPFTRVDYVNQLGETTLYFTPGATDAGWRFHAWGAQDIQVTHMYLLPA